MTQLLSEYDIEAAHLYQLTDGKQTIIDKGRHLPLGGCKTPKQSREIAEVDRMFDILLLRCRSYARAFRDMRERIENL